MRTLRRFSLYGTSLTLSILRMTLCVSFRGRGQLVSRGGSEAPKGRTLPET